MRVPRFRIALALILLAVTAGFDLAASPEVFAVAELVHEDGTSVDPVLAEALRSFDPLVRATAARVVAVRGLAQLLPEISDVLAAEDDATAAREEIRTLALLGGPEELTAATTAAARWPAGMDDALALAVARRGGVDAIRAYSSLLRETRMSNHAAFFRLALWQNGQSLPLAASRMVGDSDEKGWSGLLAALLESNAAMHPPVIASALDAPSEEIRNASIWYLLRGYSAAPDSVPPIVREHLIAARDELSSDREDFGRELLRRMLGGERTESDRWMQFLDSEESDRIFRGEHAPLHLLTEAEYAVRYARCEVQSQACAMERKYPGRKIPSQPVTPPAFDLPSVLPAGLAAAVLDGARCRSRWIGVAPATVDRAGRVQTVDLGEVVTSKSCRKGLETLLRLSFASNRSINSDLAGPVLLVSADGNATCLDEGGVGDPDSGLVMADDRVQSPKILKRVAPKFPANVRRVMSGGTNVSIVAEALISKSGCIRSIWLISQSPYPELNGALVTALSQWTFAPGTLDGEPVDVRFTVTSNFRTH